MTEYQALRKAGVAACRQYRSLLKDAAEIWERCRNESKPAHAEYWAASARDWARRLTVERKLLRALRAGGPVRWREAVLDLRPEQTDAMLRNLGVTTAPARWSH